MHTCSPWESKRSETFLSADPIYSCFNIYKQKTVDVVNNWERYNLFQINPDKKRFSAENDLANFLDKTPVSLPSLFCSLSLMFWGH